MIREQGRGDGGCIEVITGGMFSGKSEELVRRLRRALIARQRVQVFRIATDTRGGEGDVLRTRDNRSLSAVTVTSSDEMREKLSLGVEVVGIDEAQFFDGGLVELVTELADLGVRVIVAGLDLDFRRRSFGPIPELMAIAEYVDKMHAVCMRCGAAAQYSLRIAAGEQQVLVGDFESYEPLCRRCYGSSSEADLDSDEADEIESADQARAS